MYDYMIIGGGIIGSSIARELAYATNASIAVIEKESQVGMHASGRNSGVIHSGFNLKPGSTKARMCVEGSRKLRDYCREHKVDMDETGTIVAASDSDEVAVLEELLQRGIENEVPGIEMITREQLRQKEQYSAGIAALYSPTGAVVDSAQLLNSIVEDSKKQGVTYIMNSKVKEIDGDNIITTNRTIKAKHIINCAGLYADKIAHMIGIGNAYSVIPFRGEYFEVARDCVNSMIYQPPNLEFPFLSIHLTRETDGRILAGPSAVLSLGRESYDKQINCKETAQMLLSTNFLLLATHPEFLKMAYQNFKTSLTKKAFLEQVRSLVPDIRAEDLTPSRSGIRAQMVERNGKLVDDILVIYSENSTHVLNTVSPGMTCSLAFAEHIVRKISE
jgi:L-2-hydroxyglutarate oxidase LhgO